MRLRSALAWVEAAGAFAAFLTLLVDGPMWIAIAGMLVCLVGAFYQVATTPTGPRRPE